MAIFNSILDTIGNTPMIRLQKLAPQGVNVFVKVEAFNPMGSVKDRMARAVIEAAERSGELQPGQTVIEATSGNTGIGLAMVCAQKGYPLVVTMSENFSIERRKLLRYLGAEVVLTPAAEKGTGMLRKAEELAQQHGYFLCRQFDNQINADIHTQTTAQEILRDLAGEKLDYFVCGFGTGGTLQGTARGLKLADSAIQIAVAEPDNSQLIGSGIPQSRHSNGSIEASHPNFRPHPMQGLSPDFIPSLAETAINLALVDQTVPVSGQASLDNAKALAQQEGIFVGISSGAILTAALELAQKAKPGSNIVCLLPDTGERYLSTPLFADISEEMTLSEMALSTSTPGYQFAVPTEVNPQTSSVKKASNTKSTAVTDLIDEEADQFVSQQINTQPVVMFALEWCEFCWAVRKLFKALNISYTSIDIDSVQYQANQFGGKIRKVLTDKYQLPTIPQIFIGGHCIGGASDLFNALVDGSLFTLLEQTSVGYEKDKNIDPASMLPNWIHPRKSA